MLIIGAKGFAKEVLEIAFQRDEIKDIVFYDDVNKNVPDKLYNRFEVLKNLSQATTYFKNIDNRFTIGIGNPLLRKELYHKFKSIGGIFSSLISPLANIGHYGTKIGIGCNIMTGTIITNDVTVHKGALINLNCTIGHDSVIGEFVELSPGTHISGNCKIGNYVSFGTNASVLPNISVGSNVVVGAGAVITKNIPDNCMVAGVPATIKKELTPPQF